MTEIEAQKAFVQLVADLCKENLTGDMRELVTQQKSISTNTLERFADKIDDYHKSTVIKLRAIWDMWIEASRWYKPSERVPENNARIYFIAKAHSNNYQTFGHYYKAEMGTVSTWRGELGDITNSSRIICWRYEPQPPAGIMESTP